MLEYFFQPFIPCQKIKQTKIIEIIDCDTKITEKMAIPKIDSSVFSNIVHVSILLKLVIID